MTTFYWHQFDTPLGPMLATADDEKLIRLDYGSFYEKGPLHERHIRKFRDRTPSIIEKDTPILKKTEQQLQEYFEGTRTEFSLSYEFQGTPFQKEVWKSLAEGVPFGKTCSYKDLAEASGREKAVRAIGGAMNRNPFSIIVPCHRVVGHNGKLTGYGGGVDKKRYLLDMETTRM